MAYWVEQSLLMASDQMIYCSAEQKQYRTNMDGYKIQSGATLPNKAVRAEQLLFLYSVSEQLIANHKRNHYLLFCVAFPKSKLCYKYENNCNAYKISFFCPFRIQSTSTKGTTSFQLHSPSSSLQISKGESQNQKKCAYVESNVQYDTRCWACWCWLWERGPSSPTLSRSS